MLDEFVAPNRVSGMGTRRSQVGRRNIAWKPPSALKVAWEAADRLCSKRFHPIQPELLGILTREGEFTIRKSQSPNHNFAGWLKR